MPEVKLMTPLFDGGMYNRTGRRMRAVFIKEVADGTTTYRLWRKDGKPEIEYPRCDNDRYTMRWGSHPITSSTAIIWATRTRRTNRSPAVATPFARRWLRLLQGPTSPNTSPKWATPSRQWPPCWTWWRCRKEQRHGQKEIDGAGRAVSVQG